MHINIERDALADALAVVERRARSKTIEILRHLRMDAKDGALDIMGHDLEACSEVTASADVKTHGVTAVPADTLGKLVRSIPKGAHIVMKLDGSQLKVSSGKSNYRVPVLGVQDFPPPMAPDGGVGLSLTGEDVATLFDRAKGIVDVAIDRPYSSGIYLHAAGGLLSAAAISADGTRLLRFCSTVEITECPSVIVPRAALEEILKIGAKGCSLHWSGRLLTASNEGRRYTTKLIDASFPEYDNFLIPSDGPYIEIDSELLSNAVSRLSSIATEKSSISISWKSEATELEISLDGAAGQGTERVECDASGVIAGNLLVSPDHLSSLTSALNADCLRLYVAPQKVRIVAAASPLTLAMQAGRRPMVMAEAA